MSSSMSSASANGHTLRSSYNEPPAGNSNSGELAGGAFARSKQKTVLRPRANSKSLSVAPGLVNGNTGSSAASASSSAYASSPLSHRSGAVPPALPLSSIPSATSSSASSAYGSPAIASSSYVPYDGPHTPTFSTFFPPETPPATPGPFWSTSAAAAAAAGRRSSGGTGKGLGISTARDDSVKGWFKGTAQGTTVWLTPGNDRNGKRRVSDGILSPQAESYNDRFNARAGPSSAWRQTLNSWRPRTPLSRLVAVVAALLITLLLYRLLPTSPPTLHPHALPHAAPRFRQTYQPIPSSKEYDALRIHDPHPPGALAADTAAGAGSVAAQKAGWTWRDSREELGCLLHYVTSSGNAALPELDPDEPLDPQLILDFNPFSHAGGARSGRRMVEQTVDDFWSGRSTLGGGRVVIVGKQTDPAAMSIRAALEDLEIDTEGAFISVEGRSDTYQLHRLLERIIAVPRLPALIVGGRPIGSYLQMLSMQYSGELYRALDEAGVKYQRPVEEDYAEDDDDDDDDDALGGAKREAWDGGDPIEAARPW